MFANQDQALLELDTVLAKIRWTKATPKKKLEARELIIRAKIDAMNNQLEVAHAAMRTVINLVKI